MTPIAIPTGLPPKEAIEFFRRKGYAIGFNWQDVYATQHAKAFTVAKVMRADLLATIQKAVDRSIADGIALDTFRKELTPLLQAEGWWGVKPMIDPKDGETKDVQLGSPRRLETIFDTNLRTSYSAGRWEQIDRTKKVRPYLRYVATLDARTRAEHKAWHNTVLPADHPWWKTHFPPNGWHCRCHTQQLSAADLGRYGLAVSPDPVVDLVTYRNSRTGETREVPAGIDPGFDTNPGVTSLAAYRAMLADRVAAAPADLRDALAS